MSCLSKRKDPPAPSCSSLMDLKQIKSIISDNLKAGRGMYEGLESSEIAQYNRYLMFGENDEAFPSQEEWSMIVD